MYSLQPVMVITRNKTTEHGILSAYFYLDPHSPPRAREYKLVLSRPDRTPIYDLGSGLYYKSIIRAKDAAEFAILRDRSKKY